MLWSAVSLWLLLVAASAESFNSFQKGTTTEKPDMPYEDSPILKPRKHISEFTDPETGLNPFVDIEEGRTSTGRNVMKDERRVDPPILDFDLVEGDSTDRRFGFNIPQPSEEPFDYRWPHFEDAINKDPPITTTQYLSETPQTTTNVYINTPEVAFDIQRTEEQKIKKEIANSSVSKDSIIYASSTVVIVIALALLFGICWWRRKLKRTQSPVAVEDGDLKC